MRVLQYGAKSLKPIVNFYDWRSRIPAVFSGEGYLIFIIWALSQD